ncbi:non-ribosomal peptide synthetase [Kitasatospora phosalacinea]|uniref:non-ribosomal peptide synthetase n=1 Tax=Kitasatospora phosalacinea TaxID=2065 RepID=UPI0009DD2775|nr:non-ribosomal peptide synthetase [Kitasatospora phosalacinea]
MVFPRAAQGPPQPVLTWRFAVQAVDNILRRACEKFADATAVSSTVETVTYSQLLDRSLGVASELQEMGVGNGDAVGIVGRRSAAVIAAVIGTWMSGAAVMLVDEALPDVRRETMLGTGPVRAVADCTDAPRIRLSARHAAGAPGVLDDRDHAYVAFTSGSTGTPKAIVGSHTGLSSFLRWQSEEFGVGPQDRFAHLTNPSFDVWFRDALTPLVSGATLCVPDQLHLDAAGALDFLREQRITALHLVPSLGKVWTAAAAGAAPVPSVRHAFFAGEPLDSELVRQWREYFPGCEVVNLYGPTETTLAQHFHRVPADPGPGIQPVGRNLPGSRSFVLDEERRVCGPGVVGEIHIAAEHPAHGYLVDGRIVAPFVGIDVDGERISAYPTGDRGRRAAGGELEVLGRADEQVKIAGVRIELQEVRAVIQAHPSVREVFVCAQEERFTKVVVAVLEGDAEAEPQLRAHLGERLMSVMVPSAFVYLPTLPKLPNGKIDRKALAAVAAEHLRERGRRAAGPAASGAVADRLAALWRSVTGGGAGRLADRDVTFFDASGTSLTIVVLHAQVQAEFGVAFPLVRLFEHASFNAQLSFLEQLLNEPGGRRPGSTASTTGAASRRRVLTARRTRRSRGLSTPDLG